jgi:hypothetical protein
VVAVPLVAVTNTIVGFLRAHSIEVARRQAIATPALSDAGGDAAVAESQPS